MIKILVNTPDVLLVKTEEKGRCVVAARPYKKLDIIFTSPIVKEKIKNINKTILKNYYLVDDSNSDTGYIAFGLCSFISHCSKEQNVDYSFDYDNSMVNFYALTNIVKGQELLVDYRYNEKEIIEFEECAPIFMDIQD